MKFKINQRVKLTHSHTNCKAGKVVGVEIRYVVKQDDGLAFLFDESRLEKESEVRNGS